jgi:hypothetical protein
MRPITERRVARGLALAERVLLGLGDLQLHGRELRTLMGAVTPGLVGGFAAAAPPVLSGLELEDGGDFGGDRWAGNGRMRGLGVEVETPR